MRPGIRAHLTLPEDLTKTEAHRIAMWVQTLV
jgi:hypothetical protein